MSLIVIGLSGERHVGKSRIAAYLEDAFDFSRAHPFNGGKAACRAYFEHLGATPDEAWRMTDGDLKDTPSPYLPDNSTARYYMEETGFFMGNTLGPKWTIGAELDLIEKKAARNGAGPDDDVFVIMESIVYEIDYLRERCNVLVIEVIRPEADSTIQAHKTSAASKTIVPDIKFMNDGDDLDALYRKIDALVGEKFGLVPKQQSVTPEI